VSNLGVSSYAPVPIQSPSTTVGLPFVTSTAPTIAAPSTAATGSLAGTASSVP
jgi:hypothetical protein